MEVCVEALIGERWCMVLLRENTKYKDKLRMDKRGAKKKECKECGYLGKVNEDEICINCEEEDKRKMDLNKCKQCRRKVQGDDEGIQCDKCGLWYHAVCENIGEALYKDLQKDNDELWFCRRCKPTVKKNLLENKKLKEDNVRMKEELIQEVKEELQEVKKGNEQACEAVRRFEELIEEKNENVTLQGNDTISDKTETKLAKELNIIKKQVEGMQKKIENLGKKWEERENEMDEYITKKVFEIIKEKEERDRRKNNLVMHNIEEPNNMNEKELYDHDLAVCMDIFGNEIGERIEEGEIVDIARLGKKEEEGENQNRRPRCLLIKMKEPEKKWSIIKNAKIKTKRKNEYKRVFIQPDLTRSEREKEKELREKLREKREQGEEGWYIRRGQLERRNYMN
ncbi:hypothetical protein Pmani_016582 [Petrolisthes manimaculis]|uniref:PHD-type domain-containing protein n=1 Tax=Petrolisthes manimaculis TaxID=1843537 RepID=A0AAE1PQ16_9EUCA|nr:hypothetical protein Pmani_016582 [Petrolisthes manimaculis]